MGTYYHDAQSDGEGRKKSAFHDELPNGIRYDAAQRTHCELLPLPEADVRFQSVDSLLTTLSNADPDHDAVVVAGVDRTAFKEIKKMRDSSGRKWRLFFLAQEKLVIITLPTVPHEAIHSNLYIAAWEQIYHAGLKRDWVTTAAGAYASRGGAMGEGDSSGRPRPARPKRDGWPTIVVEAGYTQTLASLHAKMRWWFSASNHQVKIVILAKMHPNDHEGKRIFIQKWYERPMPSTRPGATRTRQVAARQGALHLQPVCVQTINITWALAGVRFNDATAEQQSDGDSYNVVSGPLELDFELLFLRQPLSPAEPQALVIPDSDLRHCAASAWA